MSELRKHLSFLLFQKINTLRTIFLMAVSFSRPSICELPTPCCVGRAMRSLSVPLDLFFSVECFITVRAWNRQVQMDLLMTFQAGFCGKTLATSFTVPFGIRVVYWSVMVQSIKSFKSTSTNHTHIAFSRMCFSCLNRPLHILYCLPQMLHGNVTSG